MRQLEDKNNRLKQIGAGLTLDKAMLQDVVRRKVWSNSSGRVQIRIEREQDHPDRLRFEWVERAGPPVTATDHEGFGTRLMQRVFGGEFDARIERRLEPEGLSFLMEIPVARLTA